ACTATCQITKSSGGHLIHKSMYNKHMTDILLYSAPSLLIGALVILIVSKLINRAKSETIAAINDRMTELNQDTLFELNKRLASPLPKIPNEELLEEAIKLTESRGGISTS